MGRIRLCSESISWEGLDCVQRVGVGKDLIVSRSSSSSLSPSPSPIPSGQVQKSKSKWTNPKVQVDKSNPKSKWTIPCPSGQLQFQVKVQVDPSKGTYQSPSGHVQVQVQVDKSKWTSPSPSGQVQVQVDKSKSK